ncbi:hypothetical protein HRR80_002971 [Exophiala dermatitidis]|uniref:Uncharacterized protein n=1 Tax=Exophiala dermatitidis TaxID=5970 RepID=A0AAN6EX68_EXODE|nr:hypothetical protein HRR80_002971 [Exophiala dermatitidis]
MAQYGESSNTATLRYMILRINPRCLFGTSPAAEDGFKFRVPRPRDFQLRRLRVSRFPLNLDRATVQLQYVHAANPWRHSGNIPLLTSVYHSYCGFKVDST